MCRGHKWVQNKISTPKIGPVEARVLETGLLMMQLIIQVLCAIQRAKYEPKQTLINMSSSLLAQPVSIRHLRHLLLPSLL